MGPDQFAEITYDQDPGVAGWRGVMTRVQRANNGSGYLAIAYTSQVHLYRTDDNGSLNFTLFASAPASLQRLPAGCGSNRRPPCTGCILTVCG